ncbi:hypothetical protein MMC19_002806 [Ptychographa xylographoides]|nr:hypothetical protein [Ptychographa xylographoides]
MTNVALPFYGLPSPTVSHDRSDQRSLAIRRAPSVASRSTTTRRHRSNRSHHGGSSYAPQNEFPNFAHTGDVEIIISAGGQEKRYMLHRLILARSSGFFEAGTSEEWTQVQALARGSALAQGQDRGLGRIREEDEGSLIGRGSTSVGAGQRSLWRYELDPETVNDEAPLLTQKPLSATLFGGEQTPGPPPVRNKPPPPSNGFFRSISAMQSAINIPQGSSHSTDNEVIQDYDNLFRIFYNYPPTLDGIDITEAYIQCKRLLNLADMYDALEVVGPRIDHHLLQFQSRLWKQIAKYPPSYLKLGYLARSKVIFAEALVHVVGQWPLGAPQLQNIPDLILELIEDKVDELQDLKAKIEGRLFRLTLVTHRGERVSPWNAPHMQWMVICLFRQWLAENTTPPPPPIPKTSSSADRQSQPPPPTPLNNGRIYRLLGTGGPSYLGHDELKRFMKLRPDEYSRDNLKKVERWMEEMKALARETVKPLMRNFLELDLGQNGGGMGYLTCTRMDEADFPWD